MNSGVEAVLRWLLNGEEVTKVTGSNSSMVYLQGPRDDGPGHMQLTVALSWDGLRELLQAVADQGGGLMQIGARCYLCRGISIVMPAPTATE